MVYDVPWLCPTITRAMGGPSTPSQSSTKYRVCRDTVGTTMLSTSPMTSGPSTKPPRYAPPMVHNPPGLIVVSPRRTQKKKLLQPVQSVSLVSPWPRTRSCNLTVFLSLAADQALRQVRSPVRRSLRSLQQGWYLPQGECMAARSGTHWCNLTTDQLASLSRDSVGKWKNFILFIIGWAPSSRHAEQTGKRACVCVGGGLLS